MKYSVHPEAAADIDGIIARYLVSFGRSAAERFLAEYQRVVQIIVENPKAGTKASRGTRTYPLKAMPYLIVYREHQDGPRILVVRHQHRKPGLGGRRR